MITAMIGGILGVIAINIFFMGLMVAEDGKAGYIMMLIGVLMFVFAFNLLDKASRDNSYEVIEIQIDYLPYRNDVQQYDLYSELSMESI